MKIILMEERIKCLWWGGDTAQDSHTPTPRCHCTLQSPQGHPPPGFTCKMDRVPAYLPSLPVFKCAQLPCIGDMEEGRELT